MITLDARLSSIQQLRTTLYLTSLWKIVRADTTAYRFTSHNSGIVFNGETYLPTDGLMATAQEKVANLQDSNLEVLGLISSDTISDDDIRKGLFNQATVTEYVVDWRVPWFGAMITNEWLIDSIQWSDEQWTASLIGLTGRLRKKRGDIYTRTCRNRLGDDVCRVDVASLAVAGVVGTVINIRQVFESDLTSQAEDLFKWGKLTWTVGNNADDGVVSEVQKFTPASSGLFYLALPTPNDILATDEFSVVPGCARTKAACRSFEDQADPDPVYGNIRNFRGWPYIPGTDSVFKVNKKA